MFGKFCLVCQTLVKLRPMPIDVRRGRCRGEPPTAGIPYFRDYVQLDISRLFRDGVHPMILGYEKEDEVVPSYAG